jgi:hypothetical protein
VGVDVLYYKEEYIMRELITQLGMMEDYQKVLALKAQIPEDGIIPVDLASTLQTKCWLVSADLTALHTRAEIHEGKAKRLREDTLIDKKAECEEKTDVAKGNYAKASTEYRAACESYNVALALLNNVASLKKFFENGVYVMRSRQDKEARDWQSTPTSEV